MVTSAQETLRVAVDADRSRIANGKRPTYHATWTTSIDGSIDVRIRELPLIHLFVPDRGGVLPGARVLIARTLDVAPEAFDVRSDVGP